MKTFLKWSFILSSLLLSTWGNAANVYWKPSTGNDSNNGSTAAKAVKTFERAKSLVTSSSDWIIICEYCNVNSNTEIDGSKGSWNVKVKRNAAESPNYFFYIRSGKSLQLKNISLYGGITGSVFDETPPVTNGNALILLDEGATFVMETGTVLRDNWCTFGPAIKAYDGGTVHIKGGLITNCGTTKSGGAIYMNSYTTTPPVFIMEGGKIENCYAGTAGGAICFNNHDNVDLVTPFDITISGGEISNCAANDTSAYGGGAIYIESKLAQASSIVIEGGTIKNCTAHNGGGINVVGNVEITMDGGMFKECKAVHYGGGVFSSDSIGNVVHMAINDGRFEDCKSIYGGGVCLVGNDTLTMSGGCFYNDSATSSGGGIYMRKYASFTMNGGEISNCYSYSDGGGLYVQGISQTDTASVVLNKGKIHHCLARRSAGGGLSINYTGMIMQGDSVLIQHNHCRSYGGAINVWYSRMYMSKGDISYNTSGDVGDDSFGPGGGALHVSRSTFIMSGGKLHHNFGLWTGGAIHASHGGDYGTIISGGEIYDNKARFQGGAFNINTNSNLIFPVGSTVKMYRNKSTRGGAVMLDGATLYLYDGEFYENLASDEYNVDSATQFVKNNVGRGGAFCVGMENNQYGNLVPANFYMYGGKVHDNTAANDGAGVCLIKNTEYPALENPKILIKGGEIYNNTATKGNGGGMFADEGTIFTMTADTIMEGGGISEIHTGDIYDNIAGKSGGGIYTTDALFTMFAGKFENNSAEHYGGGFCVTGDSSLVAIKGGEIINNVADSLGGGFAVLGGDVTISEVNSSYPTSISNNTATEGGAGLYVSAGTVTVSDASINGNTTTNGNGGAFQVDDGDITISGGELNGNHAPNGDGGGVYAGNGNITINSGAVVSNNNAQNGGGIFIADGDIEYTNALVSGNAADYFGGGLYVAGDFNFHSGTVKQNHAGTQGGGVYITTGGEFTMTGGTIGGALADGNYTTEADSYGGGIYMDGGTATISNSAISGNYTYSRDDLDDLHGCGGAIYMDGGSCTLKGGSTIGGTGSGYANISKYGGAIYSADGTITMKGGTIGYNYAELGGGIYSNGDNAKVYVQKDSSKADVLSYIQYNEAQYGGGIYAQKGIVEFSDGYIQYNHASEQGGGIYVDASDTDADKYGKLYLKGSANLLGNHVPTDHNGGGVYLKGVLTIGEQVTPPAVLGTITANNNFAHTLTGSETAESYAATGITNETRNNVFLPTPVVDNVHHKDVIEVIFEGIHTDSKIGFSVPANYVPVIYCKNNNIPCTETGYTGYTTSQYFLHQFSTGLPLQSRLFDDTDRYEAVHYINKEPLFDPNHVYLYGFWSNVVTGDPDDPEYPVNPLTFDPMKISTPAELAYFISWVNGLNGCDEHKSANGKLLADIDMHEYGWVPIGNTGTGYQGVFDGNGHTVSGISSMLNTDHMEYGFFGWLNGGTVKDLYIKGADFNLEYIDGLYIGGVAGKTGGDAVIEGCEAQATITASHPNTVMGGLVGATASGDEISSSIGIADMSGSLMGGLVGQNGGDLFNSFANARFTYNGGDKYYGGLAGENSGTIENCYARLRNTGAMDNTWFGHLVGDNTGGAVKYSYAKATTYTASGKTGTLTEVGYYDNNTMAPYLYGRRDNQVHVEGTNLKYVPSATNPNPNPSLNIPGDQQMLLCLERWVDTMNIKHGGHYAHWSRTTTKAINDDLPILKMPGSYSNAVYCAGNADGTENNPYINYGEINGILATQRQAGEAIWLYKSTDTINGNAGSNAKLYIDEGVTVIQRGPLTAYVGVTLDNSANANGAHPTFPVPGTENYITDWTDWHMFSTPLADAPLGIDYAGDVTAWPAGDYSVPGGHPDDMPYYRFHDDADNHGYFPSMTYNWGKANAYSASNATVDGNGNYYREWDFYTYYEPEYHWINFKRNSNSHWHQNAPTTPIEYTHYDSQASATVAGNETVLTQGRGYLLATREATFLQCQGLLNGTSGQVSIPVTYSGYYSPGYNFLGNPYLAYLDFDEFARVNKVLWGGGTDTDFTASYAVIDEDEGGYIYRAIRCSANPNTAPQYIAPHQGFMILADEGIEDDAAAVFYSTGTGDMRSLTGDGGKFRGEEQPAYALVNLIATDENGNRDIATVELGRPDRGGAPLMRELRQCKGHVWCHYEGKDWAIAFTQPGLTEAAIRFETFEDGEYTMRWNTQNGDFSYLHLIDNLTGADIDCLTTDEYRFASTTMDYKSRFRLVFGYTGIEEPEGDDPAQGSFAYQSGDELVVTGEGTVELFDVTGRRMSAERIEGVQGTMSVSGLTPGVYLLRLNTATGTRVQKIVINQ